MNIANHGEISGKAISIPRRSTPAGEAMQRDGLHTCASARTQNGGDARFEIKAGHEGRSGGAHQYQLRKSRFFVSGTKSRVTTAPIVAQATGYHSPK